MESILFDRYNSPTNETAAMDYLFYQQALSWLNTDLLIGITVGVILALTSSLQITNKRNDSMKVDQQHYTVKPENMDTSAAALNTTHTYPVLLQPAPLSTSRKDGQTPSSSLLPSKAPRTKPDPLRARNAQSRSAPPLTTPKSPCFLDPSISRELSKKSEATVYSELAETAVSVREISKKLGKARIRTDMKTVMIVTKPGDARLMKLTRELALYLITTPRHGKERGTIVYVEEYLKEKKRFAYEKLLASSPLVKDHLRFWTDELCRAKPEIFNIILTLGGDGTVLYTSWLFQKIVPPVLPFHLGSLGFLTNFDFSNYEKHLTNIMEKGINVNLRMRFTCTVYRRVVDSDYKMKAKRCGETGEIIMQNLVHGNGGWDALETKSPLGPEETKAVQHQCARDRDLPCFLTQPAETFEVLNDLVVDRGAGPYMSLLELFADDEHLTTVQADGLVVSTPTGSTAYSVSAGGSLVHPEISALLITPICPHTLSFRPMLLPDSMELRICVPYNSRSTTAWASFDGRGRVELKEGDHIKITPSKFPLPTVCVESQSRDWFNSVSRCLRWNERERQKGFVVVEDNMTDIESEMGDEEGDTLTKVDNDHATNDSNNNEKELQAAALSQSKTPVVNKILTTTTAESTKNSHHHHRETHAFACIGSSGKDSSEETGSSSSGGEEEWRVVTRSKSRRKF